MNANGLDNGSGFSFKRRTSIPSRYLCFLLEVFSSINKNILKLLFIRAVFQWRVRLSRISESKFSHSIRWLTKQVNQLMYFTKVWKFHKKVKFIVGNWNFADMFSFWRWIQIWIRKKSLQGCWKLGNDSGPKNRFRISHGVTEFPTALLNFQRRFRISNRAWNTIWLMRKCNFKAHRGCTHCGESLCGQKMATLRLWPTFSQKFFLCPTFCKFFRDRKCLHALCFRSFFVDPADFHFGSLQVRHYRPLRTKIARVI